MNILPFINQDMNLQALNNFKRIDFSAVKPQLLFAERVDTKYLFHFNDFASIINALSSSYTMVVFESKPSQIYSTVYYDSPDLKFYLAHHNGRGNRMKMRTRTYENGTSFFEVKQKTNKGLTLKERFSSSNEMTTGLVKQLEVVYERVTLYDNAFQEKLTFDFNLQFNCEDTSIQYPEIVIAETKKMKNASSAFVEEMKRRKIASSSMSKYCLGMISLFDDIKKNNFKKLIHKIYKLKNQHGISAAC